MALRTPAAAGIAEIEDETMSVSDRGDRPERIDRPTGRTASGHSAPEDPPSERRKIMEIWRKYGSRWETWATAWSARNDPSVVQLVDSLTTDPC